MNQARIAKRLLNNITRGAARRYVIYSDATNVERNKLRPIINHQGD